MVSAPTLARFAVGYTPADDLTEDTLALLDFGASGSSADPRRLRVPLQSLGAASLRERWTVAASVTHGRSEALHWSAGGGWLFVALELNEAEFGGIEATAEHVYRRLCEFVGAREERHLLRIWNYLHAINEGKGDDERYRRFCVGRARGMDGSWQDRYPAATAIGRRDGVRVLQVYALAARIAGLPVENPRQVNAWRYPREYGPTPPTFARGMTTPAGQLLISGTAAVVGSASRHHDDVAAQLDETLTNVESLIRTAGTNGAQTPGAGSLLKVYVRDAKDAPLVVAKLSEAMSDADGILVLGGDICRRELLVEIDGVHA